MEGTLPGRKRHIGGTGQLHDRQVAPEVQSARHQFDAPGHLSLRQADDRAHQSVGRQTKSHSHNIHTFDLPEMPAGTGRLATDPRLVVL